MERLMDPPGTTKTKLDKTWFYFGYVWPFRGFKDSLDKWNGTKNCPPNCPRLIWVHFQGPVQVTHQILRWWCHNMISERSCCDIMFEDNFCQIKVWMHSKIDQTSLFCAFIPLPSKKKRENVKKYNFLQMISGCDICNLSGC